MPSPIDERGGPHPAHTLLGLTMLLAAGPSLAQEGHRHPPADPGGPPAAFVASSTRRCGGACTSAMGFSGAG